MGDHPLSEQDTVALIELMFFAYRDFVSDPDGILGQYGFGRAHHRVLHFVGRDPGMTVQQLLDILRHSRGRYGTTLDYLLQTSAALEAHGIADQDVKRLVALARRHGLVT